MRTFTTTIRSALSSLLLAAALLPARAGDNPFVGRWALTIPDGGAGWLGITESGGKLEGSILGAAGALCRSPARASKVTR
jgi:hypothetical protein